MENYWSCFQLKELKHIHVRKEPHRISTVPSRHHYLTALQQQKVAAALPSTIDFLNEGGQVLKAVPPPLLKEEKLEGVWREIHHDAWQHHRLQPTCCIWNKPVELCKAQTLLLGTPPHQWTYQSSHLRFDWKITWALAEGAYFQSNTLHKLVKFWPFLWDFIQCLMSYSGNKRFSKDILT